MDHEVIIVGAGPAGTAAAITLAQTGHDVLILDRLAFPRDKACGDGVLPGAAQVLQKLGALEQMRAANFYSITGGRVVSPNGVAINARVKPLKRELDFFIAPRNKFDSILLNEAIRAGAQFRQAIVQGPLVNNGTTEGVLIRSGNKTKPIKARIVIGADGTTSTIAKNLIPYKLYNKPTVVGIRAYLENFKVIPHLVEFHSLENIFPDFAWIFPVSPNKANVGLGVSASKYRSLQKSLPDLLIDFLKSPAIAPRLTAKPVLLNSKAWPYKLSYNSTNPIAFNGALLAGDAAGFLDPLTGEGIRNALLSGLIAGETCQAYFTSKISDYQVEYSQRCHREIGRIMRRSQILKRLFLSSPESLNRQFTIANRTKKFTEKVYNFLSTNFEFNFH